MGEHKPSIEAGESSTPKRGNNRSILIQSNKQTPSIKHIKTISYILTHD